MYYFLLHLFFALLRTSFQLAIDTSTSICYLNLSFTFFHDYFLTYSRRVLHFFNKYSSLICFSQLYEALLFKIPMQNSVLTILFFKSNLPLFHNHSLLLVFPISRYILYKPRYLTFAMCMFHYSISSFMHILIVPFSKDLFSSACLMISSTIHFCSCLQTARKVAYIVSPQSDGKIPGASFKIKSWTPSYY